MKKMRVHKNENPEKDLYKAIVAISTLEEAKNFLRDLCTPTEIQSMTDRWLVVDLIKKNKSYREIAKQTGISVTTIGRVVRSLLLGENGYQTIYQRIAKSKVKRKGLTA